MKARLRILETTDLHMHLLGFDYLTRQGSDRIGLVNLIPRIEAARADCPNTLLFDNGDFLQGTPMADIIVRESAGSAHPALKVMEALGYDAITLGNHEFDYGIDYLRTILRASRLKVICANLRTDAQRTFVTPWTVLRRKILCEDGSWEDIRIGVIGFTPPQITEWSGQELDGRIIADDMVASARTYLPQLAREEVDLTIALCHTGISPLDYHPRMENAARALASLQGIDVLLAGHTHQIFPGDDFAGIEGVDCRRGTVWGKPTVMAGVRGEWLGQIDLRLVHTGDKFDVDGHSVSLLPPGGPETTKSRSRERAVVNLLETEHHRTVAALAKPVCRTNRRLTSYFAAIGKDDTAHLMAEAQMDAVRKGLARTGYSQLPLLASTSSFRAGGHGGVSNYVDIASGDVSMGDVAAMAPFNNPVCAILLRGWQIRQWLEKTTAFFNVIDEIAGPQPLIDETVAPYHFDTIHGLRYRIDLRVPPRPADPGGGWRNRVRDLSFQDQPLQDDTLFVVATSGYRAMGGGKQLPSEPLATIFSSSEGLSTLMATKLRDTGVPSVRPAPPWYFVRFACGDLVFSSAPEGVGLLGDPAFEDVTSLGAQEDGFHQFALRL